MRRPIDIEHDFTRYDVCRWCRYSRSWLEQTESRFCSRVPPDVIEREHSEQERREANERALYRAIGRAG